MAGRHISVLATLSIKIRIMRDYAHSLGWNHWTNAVGLRADNANCLPQYILSPGKTTLQPFSSAGVADLLDPVVLVAALTQRFSVQLGKHPCLTSRGTDFEYVAVISGSDSQPNLSPGCG